MKKYTLLTMALMGGVALHAQVTFTIASGTNLVVNGAAKIVAGSANFTNNGTISDAGGALQFTGAVTYSGSGTNNLNDLTTTGATVSSGTLNIAGAINNTGTFNATGASVVLNGTSAQTIAAGTFTATNLTLNNSAGATISSGTINVLNTYTPTSGTLATGGHLALKSTATGTARVAAGASGGGFITGNVTVEQYIPGGKRALRLFAHPFTTSQALSSLIDNIDISGLNGATNGFTNNAAASAYWFDVTTADNTPSRTNPGWADFTNTNGAGANAWGQYAGASILIRGIKGEGLGAPVTPSPVTLDMAGGLNEGTQVVTATKGSGSTLVLIGNPYPSNIDVNASTRGANIGSSFYTWDPYSGTKGAYVANSFGSSYIMPAFASFFVTASANTSNTITFHETDKTAAASTAALFKSTATNYGAWLKLYSDGMSIKWDEYRLRFNDAAKADSEWYDAMKMYNPDASMYSFSSNGTPLAIDVRPYEEGKVIPMGLIYAKAKTYTFMAEDVDMPAGTHLLLHDKYLNNVSELQAGTKYIFDVTSDVLSQGNSRFELMTSGSTSTTGITGAALRTKVSLVPNPATDMVTLYYEGMKDGNINVAVRSMLGVKVAEVQQASTNTGSVQLSVQSLAAGVYMVTIENGNQTFTQKLVKQ